MNYFLHPSPSIASNPQEDEHLFWGIWIRWSSLTQAEKVTCLLICFIPLWWLFGWKNFFFLTGVGLFAHDFWRYKKLQLTTPSVPVISGFSFFTYLVITQYFYGVYHGDPINPNSIIAPLNTWVGPSLMVWYIQSRSIRIRWQVIAWAFSVVVALMMILWAVIFFVWQQAFYDPPRSLYGLLTGKSLEYIPGAGNSNYLIPYFPTDEALIPGMVRYVYFFPGPEALGLTVSFTSLLALDIKNKLWSILLFSASIFILLTSGTRSVTLVLPLIFGLRSILVTGKSFGSWFACALIATLSFSTLSIPAITNTVFSRLTSTAEAASSARADSTEVRGEIYRLTIEGILNASNRQFFLGYATTGKGVLPGYEPAKVGTHSFILGALLYRAGIVGTLIFTLHWLSLFWTVYQERQTKPIGYLLVIVIFTCTFAVMEAELPVMPIVVLAVAVHKPLQTVEDRHSWHGITF